MAEPLTDGTFDFSLGQDAWHASDRIQANQYARGINVSTNGGVLRPRSALQEVELTFDGPPVVSSFGYEIPLQQLFWQGKGQAFIPLYQQPGINMIAVVSGLIYKINLDNGQAVLLSADIKVNQYATRINWAYAGEYIVIFDFPDYPIIIDELEIWRADANFMVGGDIQPQVPVANLGTYNQNRLFIANTGTEFTAGDPVGNTATPYAPITFTEIFTPSSPFVNQVMSLPTEEALNPITAMGFIQELDSNTGIGPMFVANANKVFFYRTNQPRSQWETGQFGGLLLANAGIAGARSFVNVNSDLIFLASSGDVHAISSARQTAQSWGNTPISREVQNYLRCHDTDLRRFSVLGYYRNRIYITANPYRVQALDRNQQPTTDVAFGGMVVLEIDSTASLSSQGFPSWAGIWTGVNPIEICNIRNKCYVVSKDGGKNSIYEMTTDPDVDIVSNRRRQVKSVIYTKEYTFEAEPIHKTLRSINLSLEDIQGKLKLLIEYKPSHAANFIKYAEWEYDADNEGCEFPADEFLNGLAPSNFRQLIFGDPIEAGCDPITLDEYVTFTAIQFRLTIQADYWTLKYLKVLADVAPYSERQEDLTCFQERVVRIPRKCEPDWLIPEESLCP